MTDKVRIGLIGAFEPGKPSHQATLAGLRHAASALALELETDWLPSGSLAGAGDLAALLRPFQGLFAVPGKEYARPEGALAAIRFCRERQRPFFGT